MLVCLSYVVVASILTPSVASAEPDVINVNGRLYLFAGSKSIVDTECHALGYYTKYFNAKNKLDNLSPIDSCSSIVKIDLRDTEFSVPSYSNEREVYERLQGSVGFAVDVNDVLPEGFITRTTNRPSDTVCFNSTLIESGILGKDFRSSFLNQIDYFLGMNGLAAVSKGKSFWKLTFGRLSNSKYVNYKRSFEVTADKQDNLLREMKRTLDTHFSPGSIICVSRDDRSTKDSLIQQYQNLKIGNFPIRTNLTSLPNDFAFESSGGHCFVLLTKNIVSEENLRLPKNIVNLDEAVNFHANGIIEGGFGGRFHYFQIDHVEALSDGWFKSQIEQSERLSRLLKLIAQHRKLYESIDWQACQFTPQVNLYDHSCASTNQIAQSTLRTFWRSEGSILTSNLFQEFQARLRDPEESFAMGPEELAFQIYRELVDLREEFLRP